MIRRWISKLDAKFQRWMFKREMRKRRRTSRLYHILNPRIPAYYHDEFWFMVWDNITDEWDTARMQDVMWSRDSLSDVIYYAGRSTEYRDRIRAWRDYLHRNGPLPKEANKWIMYDYPIGPRRPLKTVKIPMEVGNDN